jgi:phosphopantothenoylcysteine decarboxylase/phosphopantothenate--cysteine ligase
MLRGKKILLGVCGSIAAYKSAMLTRLLIKEGAEVKIIMTEAASHFITPLTLSTLSKNPVFTQFYKNDTGEWHSHVDLGLWADLFLIAPLSANTMATLAHGICNNLLSATYLSARCPVMLAPAMDVDMFQHRATQDNIQRLREYGNQILETGYGELASGLSGEGRMLEPEEIVKSIETLFSHKPLQGYKAMVTAGPTYEPIDPVRFLGNHSSGKMGFAIAHTLADAGAQVNLISGPTNQQVCHTAVKLHRIQTAQEMFTVAGRLYPESQVNVFAAAVADYRPSNRLIEKHKKNDDNWQLQLESNPDIALELGKIKKANQLNVGFALETTDELENARQKLKNKTFDFIVLNSLNDQGAGFMHDTNRIKIIDKDNKIEDFELKDKNSVAKDIVNKIIDQLA